MVGLGPQPLVIHHLGPRRWRGGRHHRPSSKVEPHIFRRYGKWLLNPRKDPERRVQAAKEGGEEK